MINYSDVRAIVRGIIIFSCAHWITLYYLSVVLCQTFSVWKGQIFIFNISTSENYKFFSMINPMHWFKRFKQFLSFPSTYNEIFVGSAYKIDLSKYEKMFSHFLFVFIGTIKGIYIVRNTAVIYSNWFI